MEWILGQAQSASPFIATFCVVVAGTAVTILWRQLLFERLEHRTAEKDFTAAAVATAKAVEKLATTVSMVERRRRKRGTL